MTVLLDRLKERARSFYRPTQKCETQVQMKAIQFILQIMMIYEMYNILYILLIITTIKYTPKHPEIFLCNCFCQIKNEKIYKNGKNNYNN